MRHIRANVRRHAIEELKAEFAKMKNPDSFTYEALKEVINLLPKKELANSAAEKPAETTTTEFKANPVAVQKMTAWHNGERKQNVGACSDAKLKMYYNTCKSLGFETEMNVLKAEAESRGLLLESKKSRRRNEAWEYTSSRKYEKEVEVEYNSEYYLVYLLVNVKPSYSNDENSNWSDSDIDFDENSITLADIQREDPERPNVTDPQTRDILFDLAKDILITEKDFSLKAAR